MAKVGTRWHALESHSILEIKQENSQATLAISGIVWRRVVHAMREELASIGIMMVKGMPQLTFRDTYEKFEVRYQRLGRLREVETLRFGPFSLSRGVNL